VGQLRWTYLGDSGQQYKVGLYHGEQSGHLLLYVNSNPVIIDFRVSESKKYSLFIGDELCDLVLEKKNGSFYYGLKPNLNVDTDLNRARRLHTKQDNLKTLFLAILLVASIVTINLVMVSGH
jgi:hypothetical protein